MFLPFGAADSDFREVTKIVLAGMLGQAFCARYLCSDPGLFWRGGGCSKMFPGPSYPCPSTAEFTQQTAPCRGMLKHHKPLSFLLGSHRWMPCCEISDLTCSASEKTLLPIGSLSSEELRAAGEAHQSCPLPMPPGMQPAPAEKGSWLAQ